MMLTKRERQAIPITLLLGGMILIILFLAWILARQLGLTDIHRLAEFIIRWGVLGPVILVLLTVIAALTGVIPTIPLAVLAGAIWGAWWGTVFSLIGVMTGASMAFLLARYAAFPWIDTVLDHHLRLYKDMDPKYVTRFVLISRLVPVFVFEIISYGAGLTRMKFSHYFWATLIGITPLTIFLAWSGDTAITEGGLVFWILTLFALAGMIGFPYIIERWNPFGIKERLLHEDAQESHRKRVSNTKQ